MADGGRGSVGSCVRRRGRRWRCFGSGRPCLLLLEHLQHPICDYEPTDNVNRGNDQRDKSEPFCPRTAHHAGNYNRAYYGDSPDRAPPRLQGRMESLRDCTDDFEADKRRKYDYYQVYEHEEGGFRVRKGLERKARCLGPAPQWRLILRPAI